MSVVVVIGAVTYFRNVVLVVMKTRINIFICLTHLILGYYSSIHGAVPPVNNIRTTNFVVMFFVHLFFCSSDDGICGADISIQKETKFLKSK